jgi:hypothetical protein
MLLIILMDISDNTVLFGWDFIPLGCDGVYTVVTYTLFGGMYCIRLADKYGLILYVVYSNSVSIRLQGHTALHP